MMVRVLILGGNGYVGSRLASHLREKHEVVIVDKSGGDVELDVFANPGRLEPHIESADWVIHLLGGGGTRFFLTNESALGDSLRVTSEVARMCSKHRKSIIFTSTVAVYTTYTPRELPFSEDSPPVPEEIYGAMKLLSEHVIRDSGAPYVIFRMTNIYGFGRNFSSSGVLGKFVQLAADNQPLTVMGQNRMDYLHLSDLERAFSVAIERNVRNEVINLGSGKLVSLPEIAGAVRSAFAEHGRDVQIEEKPASGRQYVDRTVSVEKAKGILGWEPRVEFSEGVRETVDEYLAG